MKARHPWLVPGLLVSGSAALGARLTEIVDFIAGHPWLVVAAMTPSAVFGTIFGTMLILDLRDGK